MMSARVMLLLSFFTYAGCSSMAIPDRSTYELVKKDKFLISNVYNVTTHLKESGKAVKFDYEIFVKNISSKKQKIDLDQSILLMGLRELPINCFKRDDKKKDFVISSNELVSIYCYIKIAKSEKIYLPENGQSLIKIPVADENVFYPYKLLQADFE